MPIKSIGMQNIYTLSFKKSLDLLLSSNFQENTFLACRTEMCSIPQNVSYESLLIQLLVRRPSSAECTDWHDLSMRCLSVFASKNKQPGQDYLSLGENKSEKMALPMPIPPNGFMRLTQPHEAIRCSLLSYFWWYNFIHPMSSWLWGHAGSDVMLYVSVVG